MIGTATAARAVQRMARQSHRQSYENQRNNHSRSSGSGSGHSTKDQSVLQSRNWGVYRIQTCHRSVLPELGRLSGARSDLHAGASIVPLSVHLFPSYGRSRTDWHWPDHCFFSGLEEWHTHAHDAAPCSSGDSVISINRNLSFNFSF